MVRYFSLILKSALRNRRRSALTIASIAISFCLLGVLTAMYRALFYGGDAPPAQALRLVTHHKVSLVQDLPVSYERKIEEIPTVRAVTRLRWFGGSYKGSRDPKDRFAQFAIEPSSFFEVHPEFAMPEEQKLAFQRQRTACIASQALAAKLGWKLGQRITIVNDVMPATLDLTLVGIFSDRDQNQQTNVLYFNWDYLSESLPAGSEQRDMIQQYHIQVDSKEHVASTARAIDALFNNSPYPTKTEEEHAFQLSFVFFLGNLKLFLAAICAVVTFTILLVSANTLSMSVRERIREVGVLKTLGFTRSTILG
ncbi:MAG: ABC transporter permease, partial [Bryobacteraceae bacterium]